MTVHKLYSTLSLLVDLDRNLSLQRTLESIRDALNNLVSSPAHPQHQSTLAASIGAFASAAAKLGEAITPSQSELIDGMGGREFFDPSISDKVKDSIAKNAMTPSVARDFVKDLASRREQFVETVRGTYEGLSSLGIGGRKTEPSPADVAFLIPRDIFDNELGELAKEFKFISSLIQDCAEAITGEREPVQLQELSSSVPTVALIAGVVVLDRIAVIVNKFLDAWKKVEEIREIREKLAKIGMKGTALTELTDQISTTVEEVVEESMTTLLAEYKGTEARKNELSNALSQDLRRLFGQIERGLTIEFHTDSEAEQQDEAQRKALEDISALNREMRFPRVTLEPLLLTNGELVEGTLKRTKTIKTTTMQKSTKKSKETKLESKEGS